MPKVVNITIPDDEFIPEIAMFSPEENYLMLKIGSSCIIEGRKAIANLTQIEIYDKIKEESREEVKKLEIDLMVQKELVNQKGEIVSQMYEGQIEQYKKHIDALREQIRNYELENKEKSNLVESEVAKRVDKEREIFEIRLKDKDNKDQLNREALERLQQSIYKLSNKGNNVKATEGEANFSEHSETFMDFKGFEIIDKHTQSGMGDFHLRFEEFDILVDAKNYKNKVPISQREKIKNDLLKNTHINFAWLVSLNTTIEKWETSPIMHEWINTEQCIIYINNLSSFNDPRKILRIAWNYCKGYYKFIGSANKNDTELVDLKNKYFKVIDKIKEQRKCVRELNTTINQTKILVNSMDQNLREIIEEGSTDIANSNFAVFDEWWDNNIEITNDETIELSTDLWTKFKNYDKDLIKELDITVDKFKQYIKSKVPLSALVIKNKNTNSAFDIKGIRLKSINTEKIEHVELIEPVLEKKIKKVKVQKKEYYFDSELDQKIITDYDKSKNDIMKLSEIYNVRPWQIVSLLIKNKIIDKREEAKGHNIYKETDEYKSKIQTSTP
jgi:hypothetical protein